MRGEELELLDGFKRCAAARQVGVLPSLSVRVLAVVHCAPRTGHIKRLGELEWTDVQHGFGNPKTAIMHRQVNELAAQIDVRNVRRPRLVQRRDRLVFQQIRPVAMIPTILGGGHEPTHLDHQILLVHQPANPLGVDRRQTPFQFLLDHPVTVGGELFRDAHDRRADAVVDVFDRVVVEAAAAQLDEAAQEVDAEARLVLGDELAFGVEGQWSIAESFFAASSSTVN